MVNTKKMVIPPPKITTKDAINAIDNINERP